MTRATRAKQPPAIITPDLSNLFKLKLEFNDEKIIKSHPFVDAISTYFVEADEMNREIKALIAERTKKKVPTTPKKKAAAATLVRHQIDELRKISFDEEDDDESFDIAPIPSPPPAPRQPSPKKQQQPAASSQIRNPRGDVFASPFPSSHTIQIHSQKRNIGGGDATTTATPSIASSTHSVSAPPQKKNGPLLLHKIQTETQKATDRKNQQLQEKAEKLKRENEEKAKKVMENRKQKEDEERRKQEAIKLKEARVREFEAKQREEAARAAITTTPKKPAAATTPKKDPKKKGPVTPRQAHVPAKKGKNDLPPQQDFEIHSPVRKHKKPTPPKKKESDDIFDTEEDNHMADDEDNGEPLNYIELPPGDEETEVAEEYEEEDDGAEQYEEEPEEDGERLNYVELPQPQNDEAEEEEYDKETEQEIKTEPMEEDENIENVAPLPPPDANKSSYDMTMEKVYLPSTENNYNVDDLSSNDETDDESKPRKTVPNWAKKHLLNPHVRQMLKEKTDAEQIAYFGAIQAPSLKVLFNIRDSNRRLRHSSAVWQSPLHQPTAGHSRLPCRPRV